MKRKHATLFLPALRAKMGDWMYYIGYMRMKDIAQRISVASEIHKSQGLNTEIQRALTDRSTAIADYLLRTDQRFFNSLVVGVYGGRPNWYELEIGSNQFIKSTDLPSSVRGGIGILRLDGSEVLFAIDGQHRVAGIRKAVNGNKGVLDDEEVAVVFVGHKRSASGVERTRRLFTTLNRYAKPVSLAEIIALDEDDVAAIATRHVFETHKLLNEGRVSLTKSASLAPQDVMSITNIVALYKAHDKYLGRDMKPKAWRQFKLRRPPDDELKVFLNDAASLWSSCAKQIRPFSLLASHPRSTAARFRNHVMFRPLGFEVAAEAIAAAMKAKGLTIDQAVARLSNVPLDLGKPPWRGFLWNPGDGRMKSAEKGAKSLARSLMLYLMGCQGEGLELDDLRQRYADVTGCLVQEVRFPAPLA